MSNFFHRLSDKQVRERDEAMHSLYLLANQVGLKCAQCNVIIFGHEAVGAVSYMAPMGTDDYQARVYCVDCAESMCE